MSEHDGQPYNVLVSGGSSEIVVERSRFIGQAFAASTVEEALERVEQTRATYHDARHVCWGLRCGRGPQAVERWNDDGEPARTGGYPLWQLLEGEGLVDALLVVVRYFGGVKLGTGGLARAYRDAGRLALDEADIALRHPEVELDVTVGYAAVGRLEHLLESMEGARVVGTAYGAEVTFTLAIRRIDYPEVRDRLAVLLQRAPESFEPR